MRIIDFHVHAGSYPLLRDDIQSLLTSRAQEPGINVSDLFSNPRKMEPYLRSFGVKLGMVLAECGPGTNFTINSAMIAAFATHSDMLVPFGSINPNVHDPLHEFEQSVARGIKGFKFYPADHMFDGTHPAMMEVYRRCAEARMPMVFHTGSTAQRDAKPAFLRPSEFLPIIQEVPEGVIVLAHAGRPYYEDGFRVASDYSNVWLDTGLTEIGELREALEDDVLGRRILFGSDWPVSGSYARLIETLKEGAPSEEALERMFWSNAVDLLGRTDIPVPGTEAQPEPILDRYAT